MDRNIIKRYLVLIAVLVVCAGAAWYITESDRQPTDAVLAYQSGDGRVEVMTAYQSGDGRAEVMTAYQSGEGRAEVLTAHLCENNRHMRQWFAAGSEPLCAAGKMGADTV